ncbi:MAG: energy transducer TonB [Flavobacteriales bacterium]|nr:energy transducer TonB [Flavobacteriales bacterium]
MRKHINYPEWEADNNIDGKVYVEFEVEKDGTITDPRIRRSVQGTRNFDGEVLRVMKLMPRWSPGRNGNDVVKTKLVLPVVFSL